MRIWSWPRQKAQRICAAALAAWLALGSTDGLARETTRTTVTLDYQTEPALDDCASAAEFRELTRARLGYDPFLDQADLSVRVELRLSSGGLVGLVEWTPLNGGKIGRREVAAENQNCEELSRMMAFVVAVQLQLMEDELHTELESNPSSKERSNEAQPPAPRRSGMVQLRNGAIALPARESAAEPRGFVGLGAGIGLGMAPATSFQGRAFGGGELGLARAELAYEAWLPSTLRQPYGGGFEHRLMLGSLSACFGPRTLRGCVVSKLGQLAVAGRSLDETREERGLVAQIGPRLAHEVRLSSHFSLDARAEVLYLLTPWVVTQNHVRVWQMPRFAGVFGFDGTVHFP